MTSPSQSERPNLLNRCLRRAGEFALPGLLGLALATPVMVQAAAMARAAFGQSAADEKAGFEMKVPAVLVPVVEFGPGADVDGDGAADFVNPTMGAVRDHDAYGSGAFHASRDGGSRLHAGADYLVRAGQTVTAPISGYVTRIGYAYSGDDLRYVELTNPALGYTARVFYIEPSVAVGETVHLGQPLGAARSLQDRYPGGMSDHVHVEIARQGEGHVNPTALLPERRVRFALARGGRPSA